MAIFNPTYPYEEIKRTKKAILTSVSQKYRRTYKSTLCDIYDIYDIALLRFAKR